MAPDSTPASIPTGERWPSPVAISEAEQRVLALLLRGLGNQAIASALSVSRRTVEGHVSALLRKTGCHSRTQLVLWALGRGYGALDPAGLAQW